MCGGDSSSVLHQLQQVKQLRASADAFGAIRADGRVVTWGNPLHGGCVAFEVIYFCF